MWNSFSFDLGIGNNPQQVAIDGLIHTLQVTPRTCYVCLVMRGVWVWCVEGPVCVRHGGHRVHS